MKFIDQIGHELTLENYPSRIISTVPSQTELFFYLGLGDKVVGRTRFCIHPKSQLKKIKDVGGTKQLKLDIIDGLEPDLIIANKEENEKSQIIDLQKRYSVYTSDIIKLDSAMAMIKGLGQICGCSAKSNQLIKRISEGFQNLPLFKGTVAYLIWYKPFMAVGNQNFIHEIIKLLGLTNVYQNDDRYPVIDLQSLKAAKPDYVFLSSEPFPFKQIHVDEIRAELPNAKVVLVDGEMFSWYGSRMLLAIEYFHSLHKELSQ